MPKQTFNALTKFRDNPRATMLVAGAASAFGFAPAGLWPVTLLAYALLIDFVARAESSKRAALYGWLFGFGQFAVGLSWLAKAFTYQDAIPHLLGWLASPGSSLYLAVYPALATWGAWRITKFKQNPAGDQQASLRFILGFAGCWIIAEWMRSWVFTGFPWNPLSAAFIGGAGLSTAIGTYGMSGVAVLAAGSLVLIAQKKWLASAVCALLPVYSAMLSFAVIPGPDDRGNKIALTIIQPNISQAEKYKLGYEKENFTKLAALTRPIAGGPERRLILWPEAAIPDFLDEDDLEAADARARIASLMQPGDVLLTGADKIFKKTIRFPGYIENRWVGAANATFALNAKGEIAWRYDKSHLVPFGEYLPMRKLLEPLGVARFVPGDLDFWPGKGAQSMRVGGLGPVPVKVGMQICYEIIFSGHVTDPEDRPDFIFNPSNDAWYGSWQPPQHLAMSRLRAIEEGLPVIRSTPTGISAVIDANGNVQRQLPYNKPGRIDAFLPQAREATLFAQHGNILPLGFAALLIALSLLPLAAQRASR